MNETAYWARNREVIFSLHALVISLWEWFGLLLLLLLGVLLSALDVSVLQQISHLNWQRERSQPDALGESLWFLDGL